jgi:hypothetical protein
MIDGGDRRNVLLGRKPAPWLRKTFETARASNAYGEASFGTAEIELALRSLGFVRTAPLSVLAVELLPQDIPPTDPLGGRSWRSTHPAKLHTDARPRHMLRAGESDVDHSL